MHEMHIYGVRIIYAEILNKLLDRVSVLNSFELLLRIYIGVQDTIIYMGV